MTIYNQILEALYNNLINGAGKIPNMEGHEKTYYAENTDNLIETFTPEAWKAIKEELDEGAGGELHSRKRHKSGNQSPAKFGAIHSSSALVVNTFGKWKPDPKTLTICDNTDFNVMNFEKKLKTGFIGVPHLDLYLENDKNVIAIESKFLEFIPRTDTAEPKPQKISLSYYDGKFEKHWWKAVEFVRTNLVTRCPVAQLIKHYYGLRCLIEQEERLKGYNITLLYLYWTPTNAMEFEIYKEHAKELHDFSEIVKTSDSTIRFQSMTYPELWQAWEKLDCKEHAERLRKRYEVTLKK